MTHHHKHGTLAHPGPGKTTTATKTAVTPGDKDRNDQLVCKEDIQVCAYRKWESAGMPAGDGIEFWLEAEQELAQGK